jgi:hypothetical protein
MEKYLCWFAHGEPYVPYETMIERMVGPTSNFSNVHRVVDDNSNPYRNMVIDAMIMNQSYIYESPIIDEKTNADATRFFDLLKDSDKSLWNGCTNHNKLSISAHVFTIKLDQGLSEANYNKIIEWVSNILL